MCEMAKIMWEMPYVFDKQIKYILNDVDICENG